MKLDVKLTSEMDLQACTTVTSGPTTSLSGFCDPTSASTAIYTLCYGFDPYYIQDDAYANSACTGSAGSTFQTGSSITGCRQAYPTSLGYFKLECCLCPFALLCLTCLD